MSAPVEPGSERTALVRSLGLCLCLALVVQLGCASSTPLEDPNRYRLAAPAWEGAESGVPEDLLSRYPEFFAIVLDVESSMEPPLRRIRDDLERVPVTHVNFDALNSLAIAYFTFNERAEAVRGEPGYLRGSFGSAKLVAVPWRAYAATDSATLRDSILDFFADVAEGSKPGSSQTASRLAPVVRSLEAKESDTDRRARIRRITQRLDPTAP